MKRYFFLLLILGFYSASSQDIIVTNASDTINCKITKVTNSYIDFSIFDKSGILLVSDRIQTSRVKHFEYGQSQTENQQPSTPTIKKEDRFVLEEFEPSMVRLALSTGYTYQFGGYRGWPSSYRKQLQSLWNVGGEFHFFLSENVGVGAKYNYTFTKADADLDPNIYGISSIRDEEIRFSYAAISLMYRDFLYDDQIMHYFISGGLIQYKTDGLIDGDQFYESGDTFGVVLGIVYDFLLTENFGIGVGAEVNIARLSEIEKDGRTIPTDFSLTRVDLTLGMRFLK
ncbi:hypothetical protein [Ekhidna sp.]|uniref:hypothetical protein n=1 Tax=Ekhidna sp. TaxID=2608089 RepID=UPI003512CB25